MKTIRWMAVVLACAVGSVPALAAERPWAQGVPPERQEEALRLFQEANALFAESKYTQALARYRDALRAWDHPGVRYNTAVALIHLDQPLAAFENLEAALRYGETPFDAETYKQALLYQKLLAGQVAELEITCEEPGAEVALDGERLFVGPGSHRRRVLPGAHQLVAQKPGFVTETRVLQLAAGRPLSERVVLQEDRPAPVRLVRRWDSWKPWTVLGAGVVVALVGAPLMLDAQSNLDRFDEDLARMCPNGCREQDLPSTVLDSRSRGQVENGVAVALFGVGGALAVTGVVLLTLNQPQPEQAPEAVSVVPVAGPGLVGVSATLRF